MEKQVNYRNKSTLCWDCKRATGLCSWSRYHSPAPVPGWIAQDTSFREKIGGMYYMRQRYCVLDCPLFIPDDDSDREYVDDEGME